MRMDIVTQGKKERNRLAAKRSRDRKKAVLLGGAESIHAPQKQKVGRKVSKDETAKGDEIRRLRRLRYYEGAKTIGKVKSTTIVHLPRRSLRPSYHVGNQNISALVGGKLFELSRKIESDFSTLKDAQATMDCVMGWIAKCFTWLRTSEGTFKLFYIETIGSEEVYHPWVECKKSRVSSGDDGGYPYGLYACRNFKKNECLGIYVGRVLLGKDEDTIESIYKISVGDGDFHVDIDDVGEGRLTYGMGMHLMNDRHYGIVNQICHDLNNSGISWDLSVTAKKDIEKGEELTLGYNYNS